MAKVNILKGNGFIVTNAVVEVSATSKPNALMRALDAIEEYSTDTGMIFSIEHYTVEKVDTIRYTVTVS